MAEELNICLINDSFPPLIDGVSNTVKNYAEIINRDYGKAVVATPYHPSANDSKFPYKIVRFQSFDTEKYINYRTGNPFHSKTLEELKPEKINIIHTHCPFASTFLARILREPLGAPVVFTYHTKFDIDIKKLIKSKYFREKVLAWLVDNIESCDDVWVVSEGAGENLKSIGYKGNYTVMPNGVDIPKGRVSEKEIFEATKDYDIPEDIPLYLFVGRMAWYKGIDVTLEALEKLNEHGKNFRMAFIGGGFDREEIEEYAKKLGIYDKCIFTGPIQSRDTIRAWYCRANLFIFPSVYDTNGLVVREAAACSLGSVLIKDSCASEGITDGETGFLCENDPNSLFEKLLEMGEDFRLMKKVGVNASEKIYVSWDDAVKNAVARYRTVLENYKEGKLEKKESPGDEWLKTEGEILDGIVRARAHRRDIKNTVISYGEGIKNSSERARESFRQRAVKLKDRTKEIKDGIKSRTIQRGREITTAFWDKLDKYL